MRGGQEPIHRAERAACRARRDRRRIAET